MEIIGINKQTQIRGKHKEQQHKAGKEEYD